MIREVPSFDSARERNAGFRPQGPAVARMDFFNGLLTPTPDSSIQKGDTDCGVAFFLLFSKGAPTFVAPSI